MTSPSPLRILATRSREQAGDLSKRLREAGMTPVEASLIRIEDPEDWGPLDRAIGNLGTYDWIVFTSGNAVEKFMERVFSSGRDTGALMNLHTAVVGGVTAKKLEACGITPAYLPERFDAEALVDGWTKTYNLKEARVLFPCGDMARETVVAGLTAAGARVTPVVAYRTVTETSLPPDIMAMLTSGEIHAVTFASPSTVRAFVDAVGASRLTDLLTGVAVACMGPVTRQAATDAGMTVDIMPAEATIPALVAAITRYYRER